MEKQTLAKTYDLVIIGAGPAGLEAALQAKRLEINYLLLEKSAVGSLIFDTMAEKKFYHEYGRNTAKLKGALTFPDRLTGADLVRLWRTQAEQERLVLIIDTVQTIGNTDGLFTIKTVTQTYQSRNVILTSGTFENPRKLHIPGEADNPKVAYATDYYGEYQNKEIIVVGGGNSALETALEYCEQNHITLLVRKNHFAETATERNKKDLETAVTAGQVRVRYETVLSEIKQASVVVIHQNGVQEELPFDHIFIHAGYEKPLDFLHACGIEVEESLGGGKPKFDEHFETNVPGLFIAGGLTGADSVIESANQSFEIVHHLFN
ncbi:MAG: hypothetical protein COV10_00070 [Candidatus Vogelbacteria bacterium CG10_big_fil_rev_8_21_14_0_10_51_16]|uniref:FAD/NAD(P)-binding domain-containing protein n=1 Tax=Candidatus Vogelbacteria bacterium CG10_big_fil_rev_8_21_14_0_10_51_16 TaxID=1975045 RepID=A0A2H0RFF1_9BACT|nr:MAG: hypothetical protein COV10_00070 [Candidatus Vogelbacteria bacterium CG10_big_fil_rev_8_21_14_0_10_51_16]